MRHILILAAVLALPAAALADRPTQGRGAVQMPPGMGASPGAVAAASRPGDEQMTCEQIGTEMAPYAMQMRQSFTDNGVDQDVADMQAMQARAQRQAAQQVGTSVAAGIVSSVIPGAGYAAMAAQAAQQQQAARDAAPLRERMARNNAAVQADTNAMMTQNPRVQVLMQLAQDKNCH